MTLVTELDSASEEILMTNIKRSLAVVAGISVLAIAAQAQTITGLTATVGSANYVKNNSVDFSPVLVGSTYSGTDVVAAGSFNLSGAKSVEASTGSFILVGGSLSLELSTSSTFASPFYSILGVTGTTNGPSLNTGSMFTGSPVTVYYKETITGSSFFGSAAGSATFTPAATPEPATYAVMGLGLVGLMIRRKRSAR
jgi:hypothetical protein